MKWWIPLLAIMFCLGIESAHGEDALKRLLAFAPWVDTLKVSGDLRLRHESFLKDPDLDRHRQRFRLRLGSEWGMGNISIGLQLASGTGETTSTNQSFDGLFSQKAFWIDRVYLRWQAASWMSATFGKMPNPLFTTALGDGVWDSDVNPEGFAEQMTWAVSERSTVFFRLGQFILDEDGGDNNDQWLLAQQIGGTIQRDDRTAFTLAVGYLDFVNSTAGHFGGAMQEGNTRNAAGVLVYPFRVLHVVVEAAAEAGSWPLVFSADYIKNMADPETGKATGFDVGFRLGKAKHPNSGEVTYIYKHLEDDATVADLADSDFGDGGTNRKGHILSGAWQVTAWGQARATVYFTQVEDETRPPGQDDIHRIQLDWIIKF